MYIYVYFRRSAPVEYAYIVAARQPVPLCALSITPDLQKVTYESVLIRTWWVAMGRWFIICVQRRPHIFSYVFSLSLSLSFYFAIQPSGLDVLLTPETLRLESRPSSCKKENCQGTVFNLSTVVKNRYERSSGLKLLYVAVFRSGNLNIDRYYSLMRLLFFSVLFVPSPLFSRSFKI